MDTIPAIDPNVPGPHAPASSALGTTVAHLPPSQIVTDPDQIVSVEIHRFKRIENLTLSMDNKPVVLVGANNCGKSSALHAIHFAVSVAQTARLVGDGVVWASDKFELSFNPSQLLWSPIADTMSLAHGGVLQEYRHAQIEVRLMDAIGNQSTVSVRRGRNRNISVTIKGRKLGERLQDLQRPFSVYTPGLAGIAREERFLSAGVVRRSVARGDANLVLRNVLLMLINDAIKWKQFNDDINVLFPGIRFDIRFNPTTDETITTNVSLSNGPFLPLDSAGTAVLQATQILGYSVLYNPPMVLLDEPDSHLHPNNQRSLCKLLSQLARDRSFGLLIATHSRHVLDALRSASKVVWLNQGSIVQDATTTMTSRLLDLGALDSVDYFADTETKCVVLTEDSETAPLEALLCASGFRMSDTRIASYAGCSKIDSAIVLGQFITAHANNVKIVIHRDRDFMDTNDIVSYETAIKNCGLIPFITSRSDIESSFINSAHLAALNAPLTPEQAQSVIDEAITQMRDKSVEAMINIRVERAHRVRATTGVQPNIGRISVDCNAQYDANPLEMSRGKIVMGKIASDIQTLIGRNPQIFEATQHIKNDALETISSSIWSDEE